MLRKKAILLIHGFAGGAYDYGNLPNDVNTDINENRNIIFNIEENFKLFYINVDKKEVTNKVTAELTYGNTTKTTKDEIVPDTSVNYVYDNIKSTSVTLVEINGLTHDLFINDRYTDVKKLIFDFFKHKPKNTKNKYKI
jgi:esterase/lipase